MSANNLYVGNDNLVEWVGAYDRDAAAYLDATASGTFALFEQDGDDNGAAVAGASGSFAYVAASDGVFRGTLASTVALVRGTSYYLETNLTGASGSPVGKRRQLVTAVDRDFKP